MSALVLTQMNSMFRQLNKTIYEIEANINDIYYGKTITTNIKDSEFMAHSFGYG